MKRLLLILFCLPLIYSLLLFTGCSSGGASDNPEPSSVMEDVIVGKRWKEKSESTGFYLNIDKTFYTIEDCQDDNNYGTWIIEDSIIKRVYTHNSLQTTTFYAEVISFSETEITTLVSETPITQTVKVYEVTSADIYGCMDSLYSNYNPSATCDNDSCDFYEFIYVPDDNFEQALIDLGYDNVMDDLVKAANINSVTSLNIASSNIHDLSGIEGFASLTNLDCSNNNLSYIELNNYYLNDLDCSNNNLTYIELYNFPYLNDLDCSNNKIDNLYNLPSTLNTLDCSYNSFSSSLNLNDFPFLIDLNCSNNMINNLYNLPSTLNTLDCSNNSLSSLSSIQQCPSLINLDCSDNYINSLNLNSNNNLVFLNVGDYEGGNRLLSLDVKNNSALINLQCSNNSLISLDIRNNNNTNMSLSCYNNPTLICINVDDEVWSTANWINKDPQHYFSEQCP
tara:strand:- start:10963 stop:12315 length:1353 start_codon:yes stop_codon:yes gene_type:complete